MTAHERAVQILADPHAPSDDLVWAIVQILRTLPPIDVDGVVVNGPTLLRRIEDAASLIASQRARIELLAGAQPERLPQIAPEDRRAGRPILPKSGGRWNYG